MKSIKKIVALGLIFCMPLKRAKAHTTAYNKHVLTITRGEITKEKRKKKVALGFVGCETLFLRDVSSSSRPVYIYQY
jgi:hypothetical protein